MGQVNKEIELCISKNQQIRKHLGSKMTKMKSGIDWISRWITQKTADTPDASSTRMNWFIRDKHVFLEKDIQDLKKMNVEFQIKWWYDLMEPIGNHIEQYPHKYELLDNNRSKCYPKCMVILVEDQEKFCNIFPNNQI